MEDEAVDFGTNIESCSHAGFCPVYVVREVCEGEAVVEPFARESHLVVKGRAFNEEGNGISDGTTYCV